VTDETSATGEPPPSREALEKTIRTLRKNLERSEHYRRHAEELKEHNDLFLRNVIAELRVTQDALEDHKVALERHVDERTQALTRANAELQREVGERDRLNRELAAARDGAIAASRAKDSFLATMSHELRTPLNVIIGYAELLGETAEEAGAPHLVVDITRIHGAAGHLLTIINDILDLAKIEAGSIQVVYEEIDGEALLHDLALTMQPLVVRGGNRLTLDVACDLGSLHSDRLKLRQTLYNLLGNACKFTSGGEIRLVARRQGQWVCFDVCDAGIGIAPDKISLLFEVFSQVDSSTTRRHGGTGLGLAICRRFAQMLGGSISVESVVGVGSTFTVRLPARAPCQ